MVLVTNIYGEAAQLEETVCKDSQCSWVSQTGQTDSAAADMVRSGRIQGMSLSQNYQRGSSRGQDTKSQGAEAVPMEGQGRGRAECGSLCEGRRLCVSWEGQALCSDPRSGRLRKEEGEGEWLEGPWWPCWGLGCSPEDGRGCHRALVKEGCGQNHDSGR